MSATWDPASSGAAPALRPGARAVVVDAGRHHVASLGSLDAMEGARPRRPPWGVVIALPEGAEVDVPRRHVELVAPDHPLAPEPDGTAAAWWLDRLAPLWRPGVPVRSLVPDCFAAVAQVLHPWWDAPPPQGRPIRWRELAAQRGLAGVQALDRTRDGHAGIPAVDHVGLLGRAGELDEVTAAALVALLGEATGTPEDVFVAIWVGWGACPPSASPAQPSWTHSRAATSCCGPLPGVLTFGAASGIDRPAAGLWWPADQAWFLATEVDFEWTFVAGDDALIDRLVTGGRLEAARTTFDAAANQAAEPA